MSGPALQYNRHRPALRAEAMFHVERLLSRLAGTARECGDNVPTVPASVRGRGPIEDFLHDVTQHKPAIFFSLNRRILAKGRDGDDVTRHGQALRSVTRNVTRSDLQMRNRSLISAQILAEAKTWAEELTAMEIRGPNDLEDAWRRLEHRYGIPYSTFWSLKYRKGLKDIWASLHFMLRVAIDAERATRARQFTHQEAIQEIVHRHR
ncbi:MAG TPA: hypothetical protein VNZ94_00395 [Xanthobacteraceae bacterium]|nr:hypothetical protein [Xanthobacteraceae bacterium]